MQELVAVSRVEKLESLKTYLNEQFEKGRYAEISQAIGMHSILMEPEHMIVDQADLYQLILNLLKKKVNRGIPRTYSSWITAFPSLLARLVRDNVIVTDAAAQSALAARHAAYGAFSSIDEFYAWALDDRRLPLDQIMSYVLRTVEDHSPQGGN